MIYYQSGLRFLFCNLFRLSGSVFPTSIIIALPAAFLSAFIKLRMMEDDTWFIPPSILTEGHSWNGFTSLLGFLTVFRTSQAYSRWWEGCSATIAMRAEFLDACSAVISFCKGSHAPYKEVLVFKNIFVRLMSLLHASALAEVEDVDTGDEKAHRYDVIDPDGLDLESLMMFRDCECKVELLFTWVQQALIDWMNKGVLDVPAPILSRVFQELATGMVHFNTAVKINTIPFPFPYTQVCDCLLLLHWIISPIVTSQWVEYPSWAFFLTFIQVFVLWSLNTIATSIENPFGSDAIDLDGNRIQAELNDWLRMFLTPAVERTPCLSHERLEDVMSGADKAEQGSYSNDTFLRVSRHYHTLFGSSHSANAYRGVDPAHRHNERFQRSPSVMLPDQHDNPRPASNHTSSEGGKNASTSNSYKLASLISADSFYTGVDPIQERDDAVGKKDSTPVDRTGSGGGTPDRRSFVKDAAADTMARFAGSFPSTVDTRRARRKSLSDPQSSSGNEAGSRRPSIASQDPILLGITEHGQLITEGPTMLMPPYGSVSSDVEAQGSSRRTSQRVVQARNVSPPPTGNLRTLREDHPEANPVDHVGGGEAAHARTPPPICRGVPAANPATLMQQGSGCDPRACSKASAKQITEWTSEEVAFMPGQENCPDVRYQSPRLLANSASDSRIQFLELPPASTPEATNGALTSAAGLLGPGARSHSSISNASPNNNNNNINNNSSTPNGLQVGSNAGIAAMVSPRHAGAAALRSPRSGLSNSPSEAPSGQDSITSRSLFSID